MFSHDIFSYNGTATRKFNFFYVCVSSYTGGVFPITSNLLRHHPSLEMCTMSFCHSAPDSSSQQVVNNRVNCRRRRDRTANAYVHPTWVCYQLQGTPLLRPTSKLLLRTRSKIILPLSSENLQFLI